jgi:hypothetical protein
MKKISILLVLLAAVSFSVAAQTANKKMLILGPGNHDTTAIRTLYWSTTTGFYRESEVPSFVFVAPGAGFSLGISGNVSVVGEYDFAGVMQNQYFLPSIIDVPTNKIPGQLQAYMNTSTLDFKVIQKTKHGNIVGNLYTNFTGANRNLEIFFGYISYAGFTVGKSWSTFVDMGAMAQTVNWGVMNSTSDAINYLIQYQHSFGKHFSLAASLELVPFGGLVSFPGYKEMPQRLPDVPVYIQYGWGNGSHIRLSGLVRNIAYRVDSTDAKNKTMIGYGGELSGVIQIGKPLQLKFHGIYGAGIGSYIQDLQGNNLNAMIKSDKPGDLVALPTFAYYGGLQANITSKLMITGGFGQVGVAPEKIKANDGMYKTTLMALGNIWWTFFPSAQLALEYSWAQKVLMNDEKGHANRIALMLTYNF